MSRLWNCDDVTEWDRHFEEYNARREEIEVEGLCGLDAWFLDALPSLIDDRSSNEHMKKLELVKLMDWKLTRGKWRPRLQSFVAGLPDGLVENRTLKAFEVAREGDVAAAMKLLSATDMKGVGPATASALLSVLPARESSNGGPDCPFMSDEAMLACDIGPKQYTLPHYMIFRDALVQRAEELQQLQQELPQTKSSPPSHNDKQQPNVDVSNSNKTSDGTKRKRGSEGTGTDGTGNNNEGEDSKGGCGDDGTTQQEASPSVGGWTAKKVELCLWSEAMADKLLSGQLPKKSKKSPAAGGSTKKKARTTK